MFRLIIFAILLFSSTSYSLEIESFLGKEDKVVVKINDPHTGYIDFEGIYLIKFLSSNLPTWRTFKYVSLTASDGYTVNAPVERIIKFNPFLATGIKGKKEFSFYDIFQNKIQGLGPSYLVWDRDKHKEIRNESTFYWPYRVIKIELTNEDNLTGDVGLFNLKCASCHRDDKPLAAVPTVKQVRKAVKSMNNREFERYLKNPKTRKFNSKMPRIDLSKQEQEQIYLYLSKTK